MASGGIKNSPPMMDNLDKFHEQICKWDVFLDVIEPTKVQQAQSQGQDGATGAQNANETALVKPAQGQSANVPTDRTSFYSTDDYMNVQRNILFSDLKALMSKNALGHLDQVKSIHSAAIDAQNNPNGAVIKKEPNNKRFNASFFCLAHRQKVKRFLVLEFHHKQVAEDGSAVVQGSNRAQTQSNPHFINQHDIVLIYKSKYDNIETEHMIGIVDSCIEGLIIVKIVLKTAEELDERNFNLYTGLTSQSEWAIVKLANITNFNKSYSGLDSFQDILLQDMLLDPTQFVSQNIQTQQQFQLTKQEIEQARSSVNLDDKQEMALQACLKKQGMTLIEGGYGSGKTTLTGAISKALLMVKDSQFLKNQAAKEEAKKKQKKYSIAELLEDSDSSDEEGYSEQSGFQNQKAIFPWYQQNYTNLFDKIDFTGQQLPKNQFPKSQTTDQFINLKLSVKDETPIPQRILIVSPCSQAVDQLLDVLIQCGMQKIIRLGHSNGQQRPDLDKKFSLDTLLPRDKSADVKEFDQKRFQLLEKAEIVICGVFSLYSQMFEKFQGTFDTVIIDDASLISEIDCLWALKHNCQRLIMLGNPNMQQSMFLLNPKPGNRTLFGRVTKPTISLEKQYRLFQQQDQLEESKLSQPNASQTSVTKSGRKSTSASRKKQEAAQALSQKALTQNITFVDISEGKEFSQKDSYVNNQEADAIADFLKSYEVDIDSLVIMSPFRTQAMLIKNTIQESRKDLKKQLKTFETIGAIDEFVSRSFDTVILSHCKTKDVENTAGPLLNTKEVIDYIKSRCKSKLIVFGRAQALNSIWKQNCYNLANEVIEL